MTNTSACPSGRAWKTIHCPSGDQFRTPTTGPPKKVIRTASEPSALEVQISLGPVREDKKAIFLPSGEYFGAESFRVEVIKGSAAAGELPAAGSFARQMF